MTCQPFLLWPLYGFWAFAWLKFQKAGHFEYFASSDPPLLEKLLWNFTARQRLLGYKPLWPMVQALQLLLVALIFERTSPLPRAEAQLVVAFFCKICSALSLLFAWKVLDLLIRQSTHEKQIKNVAIDRRESFWEDFRGSSLSHEISSRKNSLAGNLNYFHFDHVHRYFDYSNLFFLLAANAIIMKPNHLRLLALHFSSERQSIADFGRIPRLSSVFAPLGLGEAEVHPQGIACF